MHEGEHDKIYLDLLKDIINNGNYREDRTGTGVKSVFGRQLRFDLSTSIPILTTKRINWKSCIKELLWFLSGETDANILKKQGVHIWDGNTTRDFLDKRGLFEYPEGEIGPGYGFQWRNFGGSYDHYHTIYPKDKDGFDQIKYIINELKTNPFSRRIFMSSWNPLQMEKMALPPCHISVQFYVDEDENKKRWLCCHLYQRSVDCFLGLPFNILSYAVLTHILAIICGGEDNNLHPKELIISTGDTHIYKDHFEQVNIQLSRSPLKYPELLVNPNIKHKSIENITLDDFTIISYYSHETISAKMSA